VRRRRLVVFDGDLVSVLGSAVTTLTADGRVVVTGTPRAQACYLDRHLTGWVWDFEGRAWSGGTTYTSPAGLVGQFRVSVWDGKSPGGYWRGPTFTLPPVAAPVAPVAPAPAPVATPPPDPTPTPTPTPDPTPAPTPAPSAPDPVEPTTPTTPPTTTPTPTPTPTPTDADQGRCLPVTGSPFGPSSVWRTPIAGAPAHPNSAAMVAYLTEQVANYWGGIAAFNAWQYDTSVAVVDDTVPLVDLGWFNSQRKSYESPAWIASLTGVPLPSWAIPASGSDAQLTIYSPSLGKLWEFWQLGQNRTGLPGWSATWGGVTDVDDDAPGYFTQGLGASASGLAVVGGCLGIRETQAAIANGTGVGHALNMAIIDPSPWTVFSYPAQRSDGSPGSTSPIPEGTRFGLPADLDVASMALGPIGRVAARTAQSHGLLVTDQAGAVALVGESGNQLKALTGVNPWTAMLGTNGNFDQSYLALRNFPWAQLVALPTDWGK
jgi:hypothetical protein